MGEIYELDQDTVLKKQKDALEFFKVEGELQKASREKMTHSPLPQNFRIEETKEFFEKVAVTIDYDKFTPEEIVDKRSIAKSLLGITENGNSDWIKNKTKIWKKEVELRQFLALEILDGMDGLSKKEKSVIRQEEKSSEQSVIHDEQVKQYKIKCDECKKTIDFDVCGKNSKIILDNINRSRKDLQRLWREREDLRPCIANELLRK